MKLKYIPNILSIIRLIFVGVFIAVFFGYDGENAEIGGHESCHRNGEAELPRHDRPRGAEEGVGDAEAYEADVDDDEEKGGHEGTSFYGFHGVLYHRNALIAREKALFPGLFVEFRTATRGSGSRPPAWPRTGAP